MTDKWLFLTAGLGNSDIVAAANRVNHSVVEKSPMLDCFVVDESNLASLAPFATSNYGDFLSSDFKGFGYFCWKSELVLSALAGALGNYVGVIWVDAGCEVTLNSLSVFRLKKFIKIAKKSGIFAYCLNYPEFEYTKQELLNQFPEVDSSKPQFQATWFIVSATKGLTLIQEWQKVVQAGIQQVDLSVNLPQNPSYIEHRFDQSVFSLVLKRNKVNVANYSPPSGRGVSSRFSIRGLSHPIWSSRNRSGFTIKNRQVIFFEHCSRKFVEKFKIG